jgi:RNA polymerase sigma factor (sigma-70 family)
MPPDDGCLADLDDVTVLLNRSADGDVDACQAVWNLYQHEVRLLAERLVRRETRIPDLQATVLYQEIWLKMFREQQRDALAGDELACGEDEGSTGWDSRGHFWSAIVRKAKQILIDEYRRAHAAKRGGGWKKVPFEIVAGELDDMSKVGDHDIPALRDALARLRAEDPRTADVVEHRFLLGLTVKQTAACLGIARRTVDNHWAYGRAWLREALCDSDTPRG